MEKEPSGFTVSPSSVVLNGTDELIKVNVKNISSRSCHYQIFTPDAQHMKVMTPRTFSLAPGMTKIVKMQHIASAKCTWLPQIIQVVNTFGQRIYLHCRCFQQQHVEIKKVEVQRDVQLQRLKVNQQKIIQLAIGNVSNHNLKMRAKFALPTDMESKMSFKLESQQMILLKNDKKILKSSLKLLKQTQFQFWINLQFLEEDTKQRWEEHIRITGNSLLRSQFVADGNYNRIDSLSHELLNGTNINGSLFLINNYHQNCPFKLLEVMEIVDYKSYCQRLSQLTLKLSQKEGSVQAKSLKQISYSLQSKPHENDVSFTARYSQLGIKDEVNSYKLRNSNFFKKNLQVVIKIQFGQDNPIIFKLKTHIINPALKITRNTNKNIDSYDIFNDSGLDIPYKFNNNLYFNVKNFKGKFKPGLNHIDVEWKKCQNTGSLKTKQNINDGYRCAVKMEIPMNQITLYEPVALMQRPKTAMIRSGSMGNMNKDTLRERISLRAPSKTGEVGVKTMKEVSKIDYLQKPGKYSKGEEFDEDQFKYLQINQSDKGTILTNSHKSKNVFAHFPQKGYLFLQNQHSYLLQHEKKSLRFEMCGRAFLLKSRQIQDKQPYKIIKKQLLFCFSQGQKDFQVTRQIQVTNKSNDFLMMYCLSIDDQYFHSLEEDNKILIAPKATNTFKISFFPEAEIKLREGKITRNLQFLINNQKQFITCEGDFLTADIEIDQKLLNFNNCRYSSDEITKQLTLTNKGLNKVNFMIEHSQMIKITPKSATIIEKSKQTITLSFSPAKLTKNYEQHIKIYIKGSHLITIPLKVNTLQPDIHCLEQLIDFKQGYLTQTLTSTINIVNRNLYPCNLNIQLNQTFIKGPNNLYIDAGETKKIELKLQVKDVGDKFVKLPKNFIQLDGYGAINCPTQYHFNGKKTLLQILPENPFSNIIFSQIQQSKNFKIKNLSPDTARIRMALTPKQSQQLLIVSCEPSTSELVSGQQRQFKLHSIRVDEQNFKKQCRIFNYNLSLYLNGSQLYRSIDFQICLPPPQLQIQPKQVFFPLATIGTWSKCSFKIINKGYKQVLIAIKKPVNISFQLDYQIQKGNRLTKLNNQTQVTVFFKSKKCTSFGIVFDIDDNFGKNYQVKLFGTASNSSILNCQKHISSSSRGFSANQIRLSCTPSFTSTSCFQHNDQAENARFINRWIAGILPDCSKQNQSFNLWLRNPRHFLNFLIFLRCDINLQSKEEMSMQWMLEELKKIGYPLYTIQTQKLKQGNQSQWLMFFWFMFSHDIVSEQCLKWVNKVCGISLETYQNAFNHHKKILMDLFSRLLEPIFKGKVTQWHKIIQCLQPSFPFLAKIDNKRQFIFVLNMIYHKFSKMEKEKIYTSTFEHQVQLHSQFKDKKCFWILANNNFQTSTSSNCLSTKYASEKKLFSFWLEGTGQAGIKIKDDLNIGIWNNSLYEPARIYELQINKKAPKIHNICIECEDKCSQQWKLDFPCEFESEYFFDFSGGLQFKCKMPDIGVIKSGQIMQFRVIYTPTNLKQHCGVLKISNKYQQHIYNLKGKPLRSNYVQLQKIIRLPQGQKYIETISLSEDPAVCTELTIYKVIELGEKSQELKFMEAKSNKKQIIVQITLQFAKVMYNRQIILQVANEQLTFSKNIRLIINVTPKPVLIQAQLRGIIDKVINQKIPILNPLPIKQNCFVTLNKITKEEYQNYGKFQLQGQQHPSSSIIEKADWQFKLNQVGKIVLKPNQKVNIQLSFLPVTLTETCCQIRLKMDGSQNLIVYNFLGTPQLPRTDNPPILIQCQAEQEYSHTIKIPNRLRQKINFEVETDLSFIAGAQQISLGSRQTFYYQFKIIALHSGQFQGQLVFKNQKFYLIYPLKISVVNRKKIRKIRVQSKIRVTSTIEIELTNRSDKNVKYQVHCNCQYLKFQNQFQVEANSEKALILHYTPLFTGTKNTQLKLYNEHMQQIVYNLQMVSQQHKQNCKFSCEIGQKKKAKIILKNPTSFSAKLYQPKLPKQLSCHLNSDQFPIDIPAYGNAALQLIFSQLKLEKQYCHSLELLTDQIGTFNFDLLFTIQQIKKLPPIVIHFDSNPVQTNIIKDFHFQFLNCFDQTMHYSIRNQTLILNNSKLSIQGSQTFQLKPYEKRTIKGQIQIGQGQSTMTEMTIDDANKSIIVDSNQFSWMFPVEVVRIYNMPNTIEISGSSHEVAKTRISLKKVKGIKDWLISDLNDFKENFHLAFISSRQVYLQTIINKSFEYSGTIMFYDEDMSCAEKYHLNIKIGAKKYQKVWISANVGETGRVQIRLKNGRGNFSVQLKNNKMKQFGVSPMQGEFSQKQDNIINFDYSPVQYNGNKRAQVSITSDSGCFNFYLLGKFPNLK